MLKKATVLELFNGIEVIRTRRLSIRETNRYVGTSRHMDDWTNIGTVDELFSVTVSDTGDDGTNILFVRVNTDTPLQPNSVIKKALKDVYTMSGCSCEHDCCGCISEYAGTVEQLASGFWVVRISWSRNI